MKKIISFSLILAVVFGLAFAISTADACEVRGVGYWKTHDNEREYLPDPVNSNIKIAATLSTVFVNDTGLRFFLQLKGKKTPMQKVKRQYGATLLNMASGLLPPRTVLKAGELELIQSFDQTYALGDTTLDDALSEIENAISTLTNLEEARELAEAINNGDYFSSCTQ